jgi:hypothetical protein
MGGHGREPETGGADGVRRPRQHIAGRRRDTLSPQLGGENVRILDGQGGAPLIVHSSNMYSRVVMCYSGLNGFAAGPGGRMTPGSVSFCSRRLFRLFRLGLTVDVLGFHVLAAVGAP